MTGYGRTEGIFGTKKVLAEIRSVNHRFADYNIKVPRHYGFLEDKEWLTVALGTGKGEIPFPDTVTAIVSENEEEVIEGITWINRG